jgi:pantoate--beta-alanine ligase
LALSSRNVRLTVEEKQRASIIYQALRRAKLAAKEGERDAVRLAQIVREKIAGEPLAQIDYVEIVDEETLEPIEKIGENAVLIAVAVRFGETRLIDNTILNRKL